VKITKTAFALWTVFAAVLVMVIARMENGVTHARTFCAYNRIFVEFEEGNKIWGTIMLDAKGKPIPCLESDTQETVRQENISI
jgi:hypothetical protein